MADFFIRRPIVAIVASIVITLLGLAVLQRLSIEQYPELSPPTIRVETTYQGASAEEQTAHVLATLNEIGAGETPQILVLNKIDLVPGKPDSSSLARRILGDPEHQPAGAVAISAATGQGFEELLRKIDQTLAVDPLAECSFRFPAGEGGPLHLLHEHARVIATRYDDEYCYVEAVAPASVRRKLREYVVAQR